MGQGPVLALCGKNLGYFPDEHASPANSDEEGDVDSEREKYMPKSHREAIGLSKQDGMLARFKKGPISSDMTGAALRGWNPYMVRVDVEGQSVEGIRAHRAKISTQMLEKLKTMGSVHTLEITYSRLTECPPMMLIDGLSVLQLSHNQIRRINASSGANVVKDGSLTKFICDWNRIQDVSPGVLSGDFVSRLQAINLSHNELTFLPRDFAHGAKDLRYLDISFNRLTSLPESITTCTSLQLLHLTHNHISELPDSIGQLTELRKLFLSYNRLKHIPKSIGECKKLEKVRLASNEIRFLPGSFIKLWNQPDDPYNCKGRLEELMVDRNPLVQPSITAFEMGGGGIDGLNRAFTLFWLWLQEGGEQEQEALALGGGMAALADGDADEGGGKPSEAEGPKASLTRGGSRNSIGSEGRDAVYQSHGGGGETKDKKEEVSSKYYFPRKNEKGKTDEQNDEAHRKMIREIRAIESMLLLRKKTMYIEEQRTLASELQKQLVGTDKQMPPELREILQPDFQIPHYRQKIAATTLDLYFSLLVFSMKPSCSSCANLFDKFTMDRQAEEGDDDPEEVMEREEWATFCSRAPVRLPADVQEKMWQFLLTVADEKQDRPLVKEKMFVACFHIHDIEEKDPFIEQVAKVQKLEYYGMDVDEMRDRLKARSAAEATLPIEVGEDGQRPSKRGVAPVQLAPVEGERVLAAPLGTRGHSVDTADSVAKAARAPQISLTNAEFAENDMASDMRDSEACNGDHSDALSRQSDSEVSSFDAGEIMQASEKQSPTSPGEAKPNGDARRKKKNEGPTGGKGNDPRYKTDVFKVRVALREAARNMPLEDFKKMVNFLIRGMKRIIEIDDDVGATYWHVDDPSFRGATGVGQMHPYAVRLFEEMGFVLVAEQYWLWPERHLSGCAQGIDWGHDHVKTECPGRSKLRLQDMVALLQRCQQGVAQQGKSFKGHFS